MISFRHDDKLIIYHTMSAPGAPGGVSIFAGQSIGKGLDNAQKNPKMAELFPGSKAFSKISEQFSKMANHLQELKLGVSLTGIDPSTIAPKIATTKNHGLIGDSSQSR